MDQDNNIMVDNGFQNKRKFQDSIINIDKELQNNSLSNDSPGTGMHMESGVNSLNFECSFCGKEFKKRATLVIHERKHIWQKPYKCTICSRTYSTNGRLYRHQATHSQDSSSKPFSNTTALHQTTHSQDSSKLFTNTNALSQTVHSENAVLDSMNNGAKSLSDEQAIKSSIPRGVETAVSMSSVPKTNQDYYGCGICGRAFEYRNYLQLHMRRHSDQFFKCDSCKKTFYVLKNFRKHHAICVNKTDKETNITHSDIVNQSCSNSSTLKGNGLQNKETKKEGQSHVKSKLPVVRKHGCYKCGKTFFRFGNFRKHISACGTANSDTYPDATNAVDWHLEENISNTATIHVGQKKLATVKKHACHKCGKMFFRLGNVSRHIVTCNNLDSDNAVHNNNETNVSKTANLHSGQKKLPLMKKHACHKCGKMFYRYGNLKKHIITCNNVNSYTCLDTNNPVHGNNEKNVSKAVNQDGEKKLPLVKKYGCHNCGKKFFRLGNCKKHITMCKGINSDSKEDSHIAENGTAKLPYVQKRSPIVKEQGCYKCGKMFSRFGNFKKHIVICSASNSYMSFKTNHAVVNGRKPPVANKFWCFKCDKKFIRIGNLQKHIIICSAINSTSCQEKDNKVYISQHVDVNSNANDTAVTSKVKTIPNDDMFTCRSNKMMGTEQANCTSKTSENALFGKKSNDVECSSTRLKFRQSNCARKKILSVHQLTKHKCNKCGKSFVRFGNCKKHMMNCPSGRLTNMETNMESSQSASEEIIPTLSVGIQKEKILQDTERERQQVRSERLLSVENDKSPSEEKNATSSVGFQREKLLKDTEREGPHVRSENFMSVESGKFLSKEIIATSHVGIQKEKLLQVTDREKSRGFIPQARSERLMSVEGGKSSSNETTGIEIQREKLHGDIEQKRSLKSQVRVNRLINGESRKLSLEEKTPNLEIQRVKLQKDVERKRRGLSLNVRGFNQGKGSTDIELNQRRGSVDEMTSVRLRRLNQEVDSVDHTDISVQPDNLRKKNMSKEVRRGVQKNHPQVENVIESSKKARRLVPLSLNETSEVHNKDGMEKASCKADNSVETDQLNHIVPEKEDSCNFEVKNMTNYLEDHNENMLFKERKGFECVICGKEYQYLNQFKMHVTEHSVTRPYQCETCEKTFLWPCHLANHSRWHFKKKFVHRSKSKGCINPKRFTNYGFLTIHYKSKIFKKKAIEQDNVGKTGSVMNRTDRLKCLVCGKCFKYLHTFKIHKRKHSGHRPHHCSICGKTFLQACNLAKHKKSHKHRKPWIQQHVAGTTSSKGLIQCDQLTVQNITLASRGTENEDHFTNAYQMANDVTVAHIVNPDSEKCSIDGIDAVAAQVIVDEIDDNSAEGSDMNDVPAKSILDDVNRVAAGGFVKGLDVVATDRIANVDNVPAQGIGNDSQFEQEASALSENEIMQDENECSQCGRKFRFKHHFIAHRLSHTGIKRNHCRMCDKTFIHSATLARHEQIHSNQYTGEKRNDSTLKPKDTKRRKKPVIISYRRNTCRLKKLRLKNNRRFNKGNLTLNKNQQSIQQYPMNFCQFCGDIFKKAWQLKKHQSQHSEHKPYKCDTCDKTFTQVDDCNKHAKIHLKEDTSQIKKINIHEIENKENTSQSVAPLRRFSRRTRKVISKGSAYDDQSCNVGHKQSCDNSTCITQKKSCDNQSGSIGQETSCESQSSSKAKEKPYDSQLGNISQKKLCDNQSCSSGQGKMEETRKVALKEKLVKCNKCLKTFYRIGNLIKHVGVHLRELMSPAKKGSSLSLKDTQVTISISHNVKKGENSVSIDENINVSDLGNSVSMDENINVSDIGTVKDQQKENFDLTKEIHKSKRSLISSDEKRIQTNNTKESNSVDRKGKPGKPLMNSNDGILRNKQQARYSVGKPLKLKCMNTEQNSNMSPLKSKRGIKKTDQISDDKEKSLMINYKGNQFLKNESILSKEEIQKHSPDSDHSQNFVSIRNWKRGEKPKNKCYICDKNFSNPSYLKIHVLLHTGQKPHKCTFCGKAFAHRNSWNRHCRSFHDNAQQSNNTRTRIRSDYVYQCRVCNKSLPSKIQLSEHEQMHQNVMRNDGLFECKLCGKKFLTEKTFNKHKDVKHGIKSETRKIKLPFKGTKIVEEDIFSVETCRGGDSNTTHEDKVPEKNGSSFSEIRKKFICPVCGEEFTKRWSLEIHFRVHSKENRNFLRSLSGEQVFDDAKTVRTHLQNHSRRTAAVDESMLKRHEKDEMRTYYSNDALFSDHTAIKECSVDLGKKMLYESIDKNYNLAENTHVVLAIGKRVNTRYFMDHKKNGFESKGHKIPSSRLYNCSACSLQFCRIQDLRRHVIEHAEAK